METKFFADNGTELDLSDIKISLQETNSKMSDQLFSKFMFPFEIYVDENFLHSFGDFLSYENNELDNVIDGLLLFEDKLQKATLNILSTEGKKITGQIDFGLEELPNFNKKLAELPLENFKVDDIHTYAKTVAEKKYPFTNFNFPRIYTKKYSPDDAVWDAFNGYYNNLKVDGTEMQRNYIDASGNIFNQNIIHPMPHSIYLLKAGFQDAGYELAGDILTDPDLAQRWVFSGTEYFSRLTQLRTKLIVSVMDFYDQPKNHSGNTYGGFYDNSLTIAKKGKYKILGHVTLRRNKKIMNYVSCDLYLNGVRIWGLYGKRDFDEDFNLDINVSNDDSVLTWKGRSAFELGEFFNVLVLDLVGDALTTEDLPGEDVGVINNLNEVNLQNAVPDMTFGEYFKIIKNWLNYDITLVEDVIYMNRIVAQSAENIKDFAQYEILKPKVNFLQAKSFLLKFTDLDDDNKKDSLFYDKNGSKINQEGKDDTDVIEINGYAMPVFVPKPGGYNTANVMRDTPNCLALVYYDGMTGTNNNAENPAGLDLPELFAKNWEQWLKQRVNGKEFSWTFLTNAEKFADFFIKDTIFAYNNAHNIKNWTKNKVADNTYEIEITTETII